MKKKGNSISAYVISHLNNISRALLEGEKRPAFLEFLEKKNERQGLYALYGNDGRLYYIGKASDLRKRLDQHLKDKHAQGWANMTLFFLSKKANVAELEGLLVASAKPIGNKQRPKIGRDLRGELAKYLKKDALGQIGKMIYGKNSQESRSGLDARITVKKLKHISQSKLAQVIGITSARVSQLISQDRKNYRYLRDYIHEGGHRDKILLLLEQVKEQMP